MKKLLEFLSRFFNIGERLLIYQRIILIQGISLLVIMFIFGIYLYKSNQNKEVYQMKFQVEQLKERLSTNLSIPLWNFDTSSCEKIIDQEMKDKYIFSVVINQNNKLLLGRLKNEKKEIITITEAAIEDISKRSYSSIKEKMKYKGSDGIEQDIGELVIYITDDYINEMLSGILIQTILQAIILAVLLSILIFIILNFVLDKPLKRIIKTATLIADGDMEVQAEVSGPQEIATLAMAFNSMTEQLRNKAEELKGTAEGFKKNNEILTEIINKAKEIILKLNSSSQEIEAAAQEQTSAASEQASGSTEVSATLEELSITAKQITKNVGELVLSGEEVQKLLNENEKQLVQTVSELDEVGKISAKNASEIGELGKRSVLINEMVTLIHEVANKTDMLSINASIEASKSKEYGAGFTVIASEIRELSKETITSAKNVEKAANEIQSFLNSLIIASEKESEKVIESAKVVKKIYDNVGSVMIKVNNNFSFTQKIDVSIKQQESGSRQAADTMKQMAEVARQSSETARQTSLAVKDIVKFSSELDDVVNKFKVDAQ